MAAQRAGGGPMAAAAGLLRRKGAAHAGEDTTVHERDRGGSRDEGGVVAVELYGGVHGGRGEREAGRVRVREGTSSACTSGGRSDATVAYHTAAMAGMLCAWWPRTGTRRPLRHSTEHVAGSDMGKVERHFGPLTGRIRHWAINKICSPRPALRFLFKVPSHLSSVTMDN